MIGFNRLGLMGRLGNQMFQYASLRGIAKNNGYNWMIPPPAEDSSKFDEWKHHQLFNCFEMTNLQNLNVQYTDGERPTVQEKDFTFDEELFNNCPKWVDICGFLQSEKYFKNIEEEIRKDFRFREDYLIPSKEMISGVDKPVALHIRRTDYLDLDHHNSLGLDYYEEGLSKFDDNRTVIIFSDDPAWCKDQKLFDSDRFLVAEGNSQYIDMCLMTLCVGHIIANSSFSWWGAWLAKTEKVIAPKNWFSGNLKDKNDTKDLYCPEWEVI